MTSRKDYDKMAKLLSERIDDYRKAPKRDAIHERELQVAYATVCNLAYDIAEFFAADNPRFDRARFLTSSGVTK